MSSAFLQLISKCLIALLLGGLVGWLYSEVVVGVLVSALLLIIWQLFNLNRFFRWLNGERLDLLPDGNGIWAQIFARVGYLRARSRRRSKRFRQLLKELRSSAKMFPDGGIILNSSNEILVHNQAARRLLGLKKKRDRGQRIENLIRNPEFVSYLNRGNFSDPIEISSPIDHAGWLSCHLVPYGPDQRLLLVRDTTEQHAADEMRRDFVANASHELRTPLTVISGYLEAIADSDSLADDLRDPVDEMQRQSVRMRKLVDDLLELSQLESIQAPDPGEPLDMVLILESVRQEALVSPNCTEDIRLVVDAAAQLRVDANDIESIVSNLLGNAVRHTPKEGSITLTWSTDSSGGRLSVSDSGTGIPKEQMARVTERFYRVDAGRGAGGGAGLGLAIVKHALARYDATLDITSELGKGSTFTCVFPADRLVVTESA